MFKSFKKLTGFKLPKDNEPTIKTLGADGGFRISAGGAELAGLKDESYVTVIEDEDEKGNFALVKQEDLEKIGQLGGCSKLAAANKDGVGSLTFSAAPAYKAMGGSTEIYKVFKIEEGVTIPAADKDGNEAELTVYPLTFLGDEPKPVRQVTDKGEGADQAEGQDQEEAQEQEEAGTQKSKKKGGKK